MIRASIRLLLPKARFSPFSLSPNNRCVLGVPGDKGPMTAGISCTLLWFQKGSIQPSSQIQLKFQLQIQTSFSWDQLELPTPSQISQDVHPGPLLAPCVSRWQVFMSALVELITVRLVKGRAPARRCGPRRVGVGGTPVFSCVFQKVQRFVLMERKAGTVSNMFTPRH